MDRSFSIYVTLCCCNLMEKGTNYNDLNLLQYQITKCKPSILCSLLVGFSLIAQMNCSVTTERFHNMKLENMRGVSFFFFSFSHYFFLFSISLMEFEEKKNTLFKIWLKNVKVLYGKGMLNTHERWRLRFSFDLYFPALTLWETSKCLLSVQPPSLHGERSALSWLSEIHSSYCCTGFHNL